MDMKQKLKRMKDEQILGAIRLADEREIIATVQEFDESGVMFLDHSPAEVNPVILVTMDKISQINIPEQTCDRAE